MLTVLVCDIENDVTRQIRQSAMNFYNHKVKIIKQFKNEEAALFYLEDHRDEKHIAFIDTHFNSNKGIILASKLKQLQKNISIVFMSDEQEYNPSIYDVEHVYFLEKPLDNKQVNKSLAKAIVKLEENRSKYLVAVTKSEVSMIPLNDIVYIEKEKRKVHVINDNGMRISFYSCFDDIEQQLNKEFYRCHNSYIINLLKVDSIDSKSVLMDNDETVPVSRAHIKELRNLIIGYNLERKII